MRPRWHRSLRLPAPIAESAFASGTGRYVPVPLLRPSAAYTRTTEKPMSINPQSASERTHFLIQALPLYPALPRQDRGHQVRRQRHGGRSPQAELRARRRADETGWHEPGGGARWRPANRHAAGKDRQEKRIHPGHARHRPRDHGRGRDGARRFGQQGNREPHQQARRQGRGAHRQGRRPHPRA